MWVSVWGLGLGLGGVLIVTLLLTTHEPPSRGLRAWGFGVWELMGGLKEFRV